MEATIYNSKGEKKGAVTLPETVFGVAWNRNLVHQVVTAMMANARVSVAHTKFRGEVRGGGKKPWRQKGTGNARHGSRRSPIWVGGGTTHGPRSEKDYSQKINRKMKAKALAALLSKKYKDGEILFVDSLSISDAKTKEALSTLTSWSAVEGFGSIITKKKNSAYIVMPQKSEEVARSFANIGNVVLNETRNVNPLALLNNKVLVIVNPEESIAILEARLGEKKGEEGASAAASPKKKTATRSKSAVK